MTDYELEFYPLGGDPKVRKAQMDCMSCSLFYGCNNIIVLITASSDRTFSELKFDMCLTWSLVQILSDFIVKHRGVFTLDTKDAFENLRQVEDVVFSSWDACTKPDPEGDGRAFTAQASSSHWLLIFLPVL